MNLKEQDFYFYVSVLLPLLHKYLSAYYVAGTVLGTGL